MTDPGAPPLPEWVAPALVELAARCRGIVATGLGVDLPEIRVEVVVVEPGQELVRTDYVDRIVVALAGADRVAPPPAGANLVYAVAHEVGHLAVVRRLPPGGRLAVVWDEALAHHVAVDVVFPGLARLDPADVWPGERRGWEERQGGFEVGHGVGDVRAGLARATARVRAAAAGVGGTDELLRRLAAGPARDLELLRMERTLGRLASGR
ncbi:MAG TPA: hypothetical protein VK866_18915 [Acidimicrobiales bacterium]|nr:hypothetical protein [Acidimicrobiales bacterium]